MRPRAQRCLDYPHPEEPRSGVSKDEATTAPFETQASPAPQGEGRNRTTALFDNLSEKLGGILDRLTGRGALSEKDVDAAMREVRRALLSAMVQLCEQNDFSSVHLTFLGEADKSELDAAGFLARQDRQFHFINRGYDTFDDVLAAMASRKRKNVRKERAKAIEGLTIRHITGDDLTDQDWSAFYGFYLDTSRRKWGRPYLNKEFFSLIHERFAAQTLLIMAYHDGVPIAGALNFMGGDCLYGRHWGSVIHKPFLHFELCYYQAIDAALSRGLSRVEAGAQGEHKLARGYEPVTTHSAHYITHPGLREAIANYLDQERPAVDHEVEALGRYTPFKKGD